MDAETRQELEATVAARRELGPDHEEHLIAGFLERIEGEIDRRVDERVAHVARRGRGLSERELGVFVPIFIFGGVFGGALGIAAVAAALIALFIVHAARG